MLENNISTKFKHTSKHRMNLLLAILDNADLRKWLYYMSDDPSSEPDIDIDSVIRKNITFTKYSEEILQDSRAVLFLELLEGSFSFNKMSPEVWAINLAIPNDRWFIRQYGLDRPYEIANRICQTIDEQRLAGIGKVVVTDYKISNINQRWTLLTIFAEVVNTNIPANK